MTSGPDPTPGDPTPGDAAPGDAAPGEAARPPAIARSAGGQVLAAALFGLRDALEGRPREEAVIEVEAPGQPEDPTVPLLHLDPDHPERSFVVLPRPAPPPP